MTTTQLAALIALAYLTLAIATATAICAYLEHGKRRAADPFDTITAWRDDIGRDLHSMSVYEASAVLGLADFFAAWQAKCDEGAQR
jgi:hypothetical protein